MNMSEAARALHLKKCNEIDQGIKNIAALRAPSWGRRCIAEIEYIALAKRLGWSEDEETIENAEKLTYHFAREAFSWAYFIVGREA